MDGLSLFIAVDSDAAGKIGDLMKEMRSKTVVTPWFATYFPRAVVRDGADEVTLRSHEQGVLRTLFRHHECEK